MTTHAQRADNPSGLWLPPLQLDLHDPACPIEEALLYHDHQRYGFFSILSQTGTVLRDGKPVPIRKQRTYPLEDILWVTAGLHGAQDVWLVQNEFRKPNRQSCNLSRLCVCFVDIDYYKCRVKALHRPEIVAAELLRFLDARGIPRPTVIVDSGRGLQVKWVIDPIPAKALPRWNTVQKKLTKSLSDFGADPQAKDASRVLRLVGTINSRSGRVVRVVYADTSLIYDFDRLANAVLPISRQELRDKRAARLLTFNQEKRKPKATQGHQPDASGLQKKSVRQLWQARLDDIRTLAKLRGWTHGAPKGFQDLSLWLATCAAAWTKPSAWMKKSTEILGQEFAPTWSATEWSSVLSSTLNRQLDYERGEQIEFGGIKVEPLYRFKNETIINLLGITADEQRQLKTIISREEKLRRGRERKQAARRKQGSVDRQTYRAAAAERKATALELRAHGKTWAEVANAVGYKSATSARIACR